MNEESQRVCVECCHVRARRTCLEHYGSWRVFVRRVRDRTTAGAPARGRNVSLEEEVHVEEHREHTIESYNVDRYNVYSSTPNMTRRNRRFEPVRMSWPGHANQTHNKGYSGMSPMPRDSRGGDPPTNRSTQAHRPLRVGGGAKHHPSRRHGCGGDPLGPLLDEGWGKLFPTHACLRQA